MAAFKTWATENAQELESSADVFALNKKTVLYLDLRNLTSEIQAQIKFKLQYYGLDVRVLSSFQESPLDIDKISADFLRDGKRSYVVTTEFNFAQSFFQTFVRRTGAPDIGLGARSSSLHPSRIRNLLAPAQRAVAPTTVSN